MPIDLTVDLNPGDLDSGVYGEVKIVSFELNSVDKFIKIVCEYGNTVASVWTPGTAARRQAFMIVDTGVDTDFTDMIANLCPDTSTSIYDAASDKLYQWLIDKVIYSGTIV